MDGAQPVTAPAMVYFGDVCGHSGRDTMAGGVFAWVGVGGKTCKMRCFGRAVIECVRGREDILLYLRISSLPK